MRKKIISWLFPLFFILVFSYLYGGEYKDFYDSHQKVEQSYKTLEENNKKFSLSQVQALSDISIEVTPSKEFLNTLVEKIHATQKKAYIEVYMLTEKRIQGALVDAQKRGVDVRVILEHNPYMSNNINKKAYDFLTKAGIAVVWSNEKNYALNHAKIMLLDDESVISTGNFTYSTFTTNKDFFVFTRDAEIHKTLTNIFFADFNGNTEVFFHDNLVLSPSYSRTKLSSLLEASTSHIRILFPYLEDEGLKNILISKAKQGVKINFIVDKKSLKDDATTIQELRSNGITVQAIKKHTLHAKAILVDDDLLYLGSENFSSYSLDKNREIGILITEKAVIEKFKKDFEGEM